MKYLVAASLALVLSACGGTPSDATSTRHGDANGSGAVRVSRDSDRTAAVSWTFERDADVFYLDACLETATDDCRPSSFGWHEVAMAMGTKRATAFHFDFPDVTHAVALAVRVRAVVDEDIGIDVGVGRLALSESPPQASLQLPRVHQIVQASWGYILAQLVNFEDGATLILERRDLSYLGYVLPGLPPLDTSWRPIAQRHRVPASANTLVELGFAPPFLSNVQIVAEFRIVVRKNGREARTAATRLYVQ
jgi:hypothetical protein